MFPATSGTSKLGLCNRFRLLLMSTNAVMAAIVKAAKAPIAMPAIAPPPKSSFWTGAGELELVDGEYLVTVEAGTLAR